MWQSSVERMKGVELDKHRWRGPVGVLYLSIIFTSRSETVIQPNTSQCVDVVSKEVAIIVGSRNGSGRRIVSTLIAGEAG